MSLRRTVCCLSMSWISVVTVLHLWLNTSYFDSGGGGKKFRVGFLPVT